MFDRRRKPAALFMKRIVILLVVVFLIFVVLGGIKRSKEREGSREEPTQIPTAPFAPPSSGSTPGGSFQTPQPTEPSASVVKRVSTLVENVGGRVDWSHAHDTIAFGMLGGDGFYDLWTMEPDGSRKVCLTCGKSGVPQLHNGQPAWHPNGEWIVFQAQDPALGTLRPASLGQGGAGVHNNLWLTNRDGTRFYQLTHIQAGEAILHPHFSHDGSKLFWAERQKKVIGGEWALKIADFFFDAGSVPQLTNVKTYRPEGTRNTFYESHEFTLDDRKVLFSSDAGREGKTYDLDIWEMDINTQASRRLTNTQNVWDEHAILSPSGRKIVWVSSEGYGWKPNKVASLRTDFWMMNADGSQKQQLTYFNEPGHAEYIPGASIIAADSSWNRDGTKLIAHLKVVSGLSQRVRIVTIEFSEPQ